MRKCACAHWEVKLDGVLQRPDLASFRVRGMFFIDFFQQQFIWVLNEACLVLETHCRDPVLQCLELLPVRPGNDFQFYDFMDDVCRTSTTLPPGMEINMGIV